MTAREDTVPRWLGEVDADAQADDAIPVGKALRLLRTGVGITQTKAGQRGGPDFRTISHWERGRKLPSLRLLIQYLRVLGLDLHDLQAALDHLEHRPDRLTGRFIQIERRLAALERDKATEPMEEATECEPSKETSTAS